MQQIKGKAFRRCMADELARTIQQHLAQYATMQAVKATEAVDITHAGNRGSGHNSCRQQGQKTQLIQATEAVDITYSGNRGSKHNSSRHATHAHLLAHLCDCQDKHSRHRLNPAFRQLPSQRW